MARFEAYPSRLAFLSISAEEIAKLDQSQPDLVKVFNNGNARIEGRSTPLNLTVKPSWSQGYPLVKLPCGGVAIEIDRSVVGLAATASAILENLRISCTEDALHIVEVEGSKRTRPAKVAGDLTQGILTTIQKTPTNRDALRFVLPAHSAKAIEAEVEKLVASGRIVEHAGILAIDSDAAVLESLAESDDAVEPEPVVVPKGLKPKRGSLNIVKKAIDRSGPDGITLPAIISRVELPKETVEQAVNYLCWRFSVFKDRDIYSLPPQTARRDVVDMINELLHEAGKPMTSEKIQQELEEFHPAWVRRVLGQMVKANQIHFDGNLYAFAFPKRYAQSTGLMKVRELVREADQDGIHLEDLYEKLPDLPSWLIRQNLRRLSDDGRISVRESVYFWNDEPAQTGASRPKMSFRDEVREALRQAGPDGLSRARVIEMFEGQASRTKISVALNDLISQEKIRLSGQHYRSLEFALSGHATVN